MPAEVAHVLREAMISVVEEGTARRMNGVLPLRTIRLSNGVPTAKCNSGST